MIKMVKLWVFFLLLFFSQLAMLLSESALAQVGCSFSTEAGYFLASIA